MLGLGLLLLCTVVFLLLFVGNCFGQACFVRVIPNEIIHIYINNHCMFGHSLVFDEWIRKARKNHFLAFAKRLSPHVPFWRWIHLIHDSAAFKVSPFCSIL